MILRTERLLIRPFKENDINDLYDIYSDTKVCKYLLHDVWNEDNKLKEFQQKLKYNKNHCITSSLTAIFINNLYRFLFPYSSTISLSFMYALVLI